MIVQTNFYSSAKFNSTLPGAAPPVDFLPFLKYIPPLLASWKARCESIRQMQHKLYFGLLKEVEERVAQGYENGSFMEQVGSVLYGACVIFVLIPGLYRS